MFVYTNVTNVNNTNVNNLTYLSTAPSRSLTVDQIAIIAGFAAAGFLALIVAVLMCIVFKGKRVHITSKVQHEQDKEAQLSSKPAMGYSRLSSPAASASSKLSDEEIRVQDDITLMQDDITQMPAGPGAGERRYLPDSKGAISPAPAHRVHEINAVNDLDDGDENWDVYSRSVSSAGVSALLMQEVEHKMFVERAEKLVSELAVKLVDTQAAMEASRAQLGSQDNETALKLQFENLQTEMNQRMKKLEELREQKETAMHAQV